jgi:hypothetical protein
MFTNVGIQQQRNVIRVESMRGHAHNGGQPMCPHQRV